MITVLFVTLSAGAHSDALSEWVGTVIDEPKAHLPRQGKGAKRAVRAVQGGSIGSRDWLYWVRIKNKDTVTSRELTPTLRQVA